MGREKYPGMDKANKDFEGGHIKRFRGDEGKTSMVVKEKEQK